MIITYKELIKHSYELSRILPVDLYKYVHPISIGGILPGYIISTELGIEMMETIDKECNPKEILIVTDLIDSGKELNIWEKLGFDTAVIYRKTSKKYKDTDRFHPTFCLNLIESEWAYLPYNK